MGTVNSKALTFFLIGFSIVFLNFLPLIYLGKDSYVMVHDNLDGAIPAYKFIAESGMLFSSNVSSVKGAMGVLPRLAHPSEMDFITLLYYWLNPWWAYFTNLLLIRVIAYVSMFLLLFNFTKEKTTKSIFLITSFSLLFSLLPFWPSGGLSVAGQPLILYLFLLLFRKNKHWWIFALIFIYTFYSSLVLSGLFLGFGLFCWLVWDMLKNRKINFHFLIGFAILVLGYVFSDYRLFLSVIDPGDYGFISHREEMVPVFHTELLGKIRSFFLNGHYHAAKLPLVFGALILVLSPLVLLMKKYRDNLLVIFLVATYLCVFFASVSKWEGISFLYDQMPFLKAFQITRFFSLIPVLIFVTVYLLYNKLLLKSKVLIGVGTFILLFAFVDIVRMDMNIRNLAKESIGLEVKDPTFEEFYSDALFKGIKEKINFDDAKVLTFGIHPAVAQYNKITTLDGYSSNYPLYKKRQFLSFLGEDWVNENPENYNYIQDWGSRLYILQDKFQDQVRYKWEAEASQETKLQLNWGLIKTSGVQYLLSTNPILDEEVSLVEIFDDSKSAWKIFLYRL
ncbi:DUF6044 family protein [Salinimicrobium sediminilitoris]|uniref:DUF6044 family protein n=1 Tax=Salinimicrobium sediminilitoris TaxID=2876715 RepID=UPI001E41AFED|nr:DUF6044 family protein [Salinimicrobium sediminilitoris]MCC8358759.1 DUF6044 family protein [Salinimicrobium sediminilitoris]